MQKFVSELIGTYALVFFGAGAIVVNDLYDGPLGHLGISAIFGLIVMAMIYTFGGSSGAHINPAVTVGFWLSGKFPAKQVPTYILAQVSGAILASLTISLLFAEHATLGATIPSGSFLQSFILEVILTFFLMLVIMHVSTGAKELGVIAGIAIGGTVFVEALFAGPISGASMNPARSLGPALVSDNLSTLWLYLVAPIVGAIMAIGICRMIKGKDCCVDPKTSASTEK
jgi:MIP family channel proteins